MFPHPGDGKSMIHAVDWVANWARANSLWPLVFGTSCCAIEMMATGASDNDWARFGLEVARASPRQADLIILAGTIVEKMAPRLVTLYDQMPEPKYVIAMGACTISGGPFFYDSYSAIKGADRIVPVDVYIPGCPPRPEALLYGVMRLQEIIRNGKTLGRARPVNTEPVVDAFSALAKDWDEKEKIKQAEMKEAQEKFKLENPDYKGPMIKRSPQAKYPELARTPASAQGVSASEILKRVRDRYPDVTVAGKPDATPETLAADAQSGDYILDLQVPRSDYAGLAAFLKSDPGLALDFPVQMTAVDWKDRFDVVAHLLSTSQGHQLVFRCSLPHGAEPEIESLSGVFAGAAWHEREIYDFFGIKFLGHPDLRRLFLEEDFPGHPLRKDYEDASRVVKRPY